MKHTGADYRAQIDAIRATYLMGHITLDDAKERVRPILDTINAIGRRIAKEHGRKYTQLTFSYIFR